MGNALSTLTRDKIMKDKCPSSNETIFVCQLCGKTEKGQWNKYWYQLNDLNRHLKRSHPKEEKVIEMLNGFSKGISVLSEELKKEAVELGLENVLNSGLIRTREDRMEVADLVIKKLKLDGEFTKSRIPLINSENLKDGNLKSCGDLKESNPLEVRDKSMESHHNTSNFDQVVSEKNDQKKNLLYQRMQKLRNSLIVMSGCLEAILNRFNELNVTHSANFPFKMKDPSVYPLLHLLKEAELEVIRSQTLTFDGADNNDVSMQFSSDTKKRYVKMTMHIIFLIDTTRLGGLNCTRLVKGEWKRENYDKPSKEILISRCLNLDMIELEKKEYELYSLVVQISKKTISKYQPFGSSELKFDSQYSFDENINWENLDSIKIAYMKFLSQQGYVVLPLTNDSCSSESDFIKAFEWIDKYKTENSFSFKLADQPGHKAARKRWPSIIVGLHVWKYCLLSSMCGNWNFGLKGFLSTNPFGNEKGKGRDLSKIPHGFLKKTQKGWYNWFVTILHRLMSIVCEERDWKLTELNAEQCKFIVKCIGKPKDYIHEWVIPNYPNFWNNSAKLTGLILTRKMSQGLKFLDLAEVFMETLYPPFVVKRGMKTSDVQLYFTGLKLCLPLLARASHRHYFTAIFQMLGDYYFVWNDEVKIVFEKFFMYQTIYGTFVTRDETYEKVNKELKLGDSTNPDIHAINNSYVYNVMKFFKVIESRNVLYTKQYLVDLDWLFQSEINLDKHMKIVIVGNKIRTFYNKKELPNEKEDDGKVNLTYSKKYESIIKKTIESF